jgi:hypothetical protein
MTEMELTALIGIVEGAVQLIPTIQAEIANAKLDPGTAASLTARIVAAQAALPKPESL